jgi:putative phosphoesterase
MRLLFFSDLHGNELALEAVLADAARTGYDQVVCLGDVATLGPRPHAVLARLRDLRCVCIQGNHDEFMLDAELVRSYTKIPIVVDSVDATRESLSASELELIRSFEPTHAFERIFAFHGTPRSNTENLLATTPSAEVDEMLDGHRADVLIGGHTHLQMLRQHHGMLIVNPGSLGQPFRDYAWGTAPVVLPHAEYAIVTVHGERLGVDLHRVALDRKDLAAQLDGWDNPLAVSLRAMYAA